MKSLKQSILSALRARGGGVHWFSATCVAAISLVVGAALAAPQEESPPEFSPGQRKEKPVKAPDSPPSAKAFVRAKLPKTSTAQAKPSNLAPATDKDLLLKPSFAGIPIDEISLPPGYPSDKATFIQPDTGEAVTLDVIDVEAAAEEPEAALAKADAESVHRFLVRLGEFDDEEGLALPFPLAAPGLIDHKNVTTQVSKPGTISAGFSGLPMTDNLMASKT